MTIDELQNKAHANARAHGFWQERSNIAEKLMLIVSEVAEAMEELRQGSRSPMYTSPGGKPEGFGVELADVMIRVADLAEASGINLTELIDIKMKYNASRPHKHGKVF